LNRTLTWRGNLKTEIEADELLEQVMGWSEDAIRLLTELLERLAELPDEEATALTERVLREVNGQLH
jgi:hypothetical protein